MAANKKNVYTCLDNYMVRNPLLSYDFYFDICNSKDNVRREFLKDRKIQEAILTSSSSLYESALMSDIQGKKVNQIESSLLKYMIRMSTRTTPYGLFAGVGMGDFEEKTNVNSMDLSNGFKYMRIDMEWELKLLNKIESNNEILNALKVYRNDIVIKNGDRLDNVYLSNYGSANEANLKFNASIRFTEKVNDVLNFSQNGIRVNELINLLNPEGRYENESILFFIKQLISNEYIISELRPPLVNTNTTEYILNKLRDINEANHIYKSLSEINNIINVYNETKVGDGIEIYTSIVEKMKKLCKSKNYLQIDLKKDNKVCSLSKNIKQDVENLVQVLLKLSPGNEQMNHLTKFAYEFSERYGIYREVNILEVLDKDKGIGAPAGYQMPPSHKEIASNEYTESNIRYDEVLTNKLNECIINGKNEIEFNDNDLDYICGDSDTLWNKNNLPASLDVNIFIKSKDAESIDSGDYELFIGPNYGSTCAGKMFGRFAHMFDDNLNNIFKKADEAIESVEKDSILVEITELPMSGRTANICKNYNNREYELTIATNKSELSKKISIQDVYVGIDENNKFYFKSKSLNKKIIFTSNHMLNEAIGSNAYRFMRDVCENSKNDIFSRAYDVGLKDLISIPRIRYGNLILSSAKWKVNKKILNTKNSDKINLSNIKTFINENKIPKFVYVGKNDNRLIVDTELDDHLAELLDIVKKSEDYTVISELEFTKDELWLKDKSGKGYVSEFVFPVVINMDDNIDFEIINKDINITTKSDVHKNKAMISTYSKDRQLGLFNDWIYFKFYGVDKRIKEFLGIELINLVSELYEHNIIDKFFYIRYSDPDNHVRFRVKLNDEENKIKLLTLVDEFVKNQIDKGLMSKVEIDMYFKELERYGGVEPFKKVEQAFCDDSLISMQLINLKKNNGIKVDEIILACINTIHILESAGLEFSDQNELFQSLFNQKDGRDLYREKSKELMFYCDSFNNWENLRSTEEGRQIYEIITLRECSFKEYWETVNLEDYKGNLLNDKVDILMSIIHMFCNRFLDSRDKEITTMQLVRHTLHALKYKRKCLGEATNEN